MPNCLNRDNSSNIIELHLPHLMHCVPTYGTVCTQLSISVVMSQLPMIIKVHPVFKIFFFNIPFLLAYPDIP
jgi:hypothetical protein